MFNPWKHLRLAACVVFFIAMYAPSIALIWFGLMLLTTGIVGGLDLTERRVELLEKNLLEEKRNAKTETPEDH